LDGDEFTVTIHGSQTELTPTLRRLNEATAAETANGAGNKSYQISFSAGGATTEPQSNEQFAVLVGRADAAMQTKQQRRAACEAGGIRPNS
jgi:GGDEF domain-containing protein